jgi:hypothetical protein
MERGEEREDLSRVSFFFIVKDNVDPDALYHLNSPFLDELGTMRDARDHLQNCVYERFKGYIESTNKRFEKLEALISVSVPCFFI